MKTCTKCGATKPLDEFGKNSSKRDGLDYYCRECRRATGAAWRAKNPNYNREYRASNLDRELERIRDYHKANKGRACEYSREYQSGGRDPNKPWSTGAIGYLAAHNRVRACYGRASTHLCTDCGGQAAEWSYVGGCPRERFEAVSRGNGTVSDCAYSPDPTRYVARCASCHRKHDRSTSTERGC